MSENPASAHLSGRVGQADYDFLMTYPIPGATASEKLRYVLSFFRKYHQSLCSFEESLSEMGRLIEPARTSIKKAEFELGLSSELVDRVLQVIPESLSRIVTTRIEGKDSERTEQLRAFEQQMLGELLKLFEGILRMNLTPTPPTYNPALIGKRLGNIRRLVTLKESDTEGCGS